MTHLAHIQHRNDWLVGIPASAFLVAGSATGALPFSMTETLGFVTGALAVWLLVRESIWTWPAGIANAGFFLVLFADARFFADSALQLVYIALGAVGLVVLAPRRGRTPVAADRAGPAAGDRRARRGDRGRELRHVPLPALGRRLRPARRRGHDGAQPRGHVDAGAQAARELARVARGGRDLHPALCGEGAAADRGALRRLRADVREGLARLAAHDRGARLAAVGAGRGARQVPAVPHGARAPDPDRARPGAQPDGDRRRAPRPGDPGRDARALDRGGVPGRARRRARPGRGRPRRRRHAPAGRARRSAPSAARPTSSSRRRTTATRGRRRWAPSTCWSTAAGAPCRSARRGSAAIRSGTSST